MVLDSSGYVLASAPQFQEHIMVVDIEVPSQAVQNALQAHIVGNLNLPKDAGPVQFIAASDLPGQGTIAERLLAGLPEGEVVWWSGAPLAGMPTQFLLRDPDGNSLLMVAAPS